MRTVRSSGDEQSEGSTSGGTSDQLAPEEDFRQCVEPNNNGLFEALDRVNQDSDDYWEQISQEKIKEFDSYRDAHPSIVADKERAISVYVDGTGKYKGTSALKRVEIKDYFNRIMKKEQKATELCRAMRDRVEALEDALKDSKVKMLQQHREPEKDRKSTILLA